MVKGWKGEKAGIRRVIYCVMRRDIRTIKRRKRESKTDERG